MPKEEPAIFLKTEKYKKVYKTESIDRTRSGANHTSSDNRIKKPEQGNMMNPTRLGKAMCHLEVEANWGGEDD